jgi:ankyrin repeat protein
VPTQIRRIYSGKLRLHLAIDSEADRARQEFVEKGSSTPSTEMTNLLLHFGADPNIRRDQGESALTLAQKLKHDKAVDMLRQHGARDIQN